MSIYFTYKDAPLNCARCNRFKGRLQDGEWKFACSVGVCILTKKKEEDKKHDVRPAHE